MPQFKRAVKSQSKLRLALMGVAGSGKTMSALLIASGLGSRIALIDTEHGSASKYANIVPFDVLELSNYHPQQYVDAIRAAAEAGYDVVVIDSLSHAWSGTGGALELVDKAAKQSQSKNSYMAWGDVTPLHNKLIEAMVGAPIHVIATMRSKTEYVLDKDERGKTTPRKVGLAPVQRDGMEYEFDVVGEMDMSNTLIISKSRVPALSNSVIPQPGKALGDLLVAWLADGEEVEETATIGSLDMTVLAKQAWTEKLVTGRSNFDTLIKVLKREGVLVEASPAEDVLEAIRVRQARSDAAQEQAG